MRNLLIIGLAGLCTSAAATAGVIKIDLDGTGAGVFSNIGSSVATYSETVSIENPESGLFDQYDLVITITGSGAVTQQASGLGVTDASIENGETLDFSFVLTPQDTGRGIGTFSFTEFAHGITESDFPNNFVAVNDGSATTILDDASTGPTSISNLAGQDITVLTSAAGGFFSAGSIAGISSISFDATSVPEPSALALCGLLAGVLVRRRRRTVIGRAK